MTPTPDVLYARRGAVALNRVGVLGVILSTAPEEVTYPNDEVGYAWTGVVVGRQFGHLWDSRYPKVLHYLSEADLLGIEAGLNVVRQTRAWRHYHPHAGTGNDYLSRVGRMGAAVDALDTVENLHGRWIGGPRLTCCETAPWPKADVFRDALAGGLGNWGEIPGVLYG